MGPIEVLEDQGFAVTKGSGNNGAATYYITDQNSGVQFIVPYGEIDELWKRGKLSPAGLREHDEEARRRSRL